jgi:hypothetical protein
MDSVLYGFAVRSSSICYVYNSLYFEGCDIKVVPKDGISPMRLEKHESELTLFWKLTFFPQPQACHTDWNCRTDCIRNAYDPANDLKLLRR